MKRFLAILISALLLLPLCGIAVPMDTQAETADDVWKLITAYEDGRLAEEQRSAAEATEQDFAAMTDGVIRVVEGWNGLLPGSVERNGDFFIWHGKDGTGYAYSPRLRQKIRDNGTGAEPAAVSGVETVSYAARGGAPSSLDVAVFGPYYGLDSSFTSQYKNEGNSIAEMTGGTCTVYQVNDATIDNIAHALETCGVVIFDSHGDTDYYTSYGDYTSRANTSYICLQSGAGITAEDMATVEGPFGKFMHACDGGGYGSMKYWLVDGTAIRNHMTATAPNSFLWMAICLGMATDGMNAPLHAQGVEVVYGYSQSVTFSGDYRWENYFWTKMKDGETVKDAIAYMKEKGGDKDPYENQYPAYPIVVSSEDAYPGHGNVDAKQTVESMWMLVAPYTVTAVSSDTSLGTVSVSGNTITATPKSGCRAAGYRLLSGEATVRQSGNVFYVAAQSDCTVEIVFEKKVQTTVTFVTPDGVTCSPIASYIGDEITLPTPDGTPTATGREYRFYGWTAARVSDTGERPDCFRAGDTVTVEQNMTLYALYCYASDGGSASENCFAMLIGEPNDWNGEYVLTHDGSAILDASGDVLSRINTSSGVVWLDDTDMELNGDMLLNVEDDCVYVAEAAQNGCFTLRMKGSNSNCYLTYNASSDKLAVTKSVIVTNGKSSAYWTLDWSNNALVIRNCTEPSAELRYYPDSNAFNCKKDNADKGEALTVYSDRGGFLVYTTELSNETPVLYGDVDGNGSIDAADAALVLRYAVGLIDLTEAQKKAADVDGQPGVTVADAAAILRYVVKLISELPAK